MQPDDTFREHVESLEDGCGCVELAEALSEQRHGERTVSITVDDRTFKGTPEEMLALRDALNDIEFEGRRDD